jgi:hypothetical protein
MMPPWMMPPGMQQNPYQDPEAAGLKKQLKKIQKKLANREDD